MVYSPYVFGLPTASGKSMSQVNADTGINMRALRDSIVIGNQKNVRRYSEVGFGSADEPMYFYWERAGEERLRAEVQWYNGNPEAITLQRYTWNGSSWVYAGKLGIFYLQYDATGEFSGVTKPVSTETRLYLDDYPNGAMQSIQALVLSTRLNLESLRRFAWVGLDMGWEVPVYAGRIQRYCPAWKFNQNSWYAKNANDQVTEIIHKFNHYTWSAEVTIGRQVFTYNASGTCIRSDWDSTSGYPHYDQNLPASVSTSIMQWCADVRRNLDALRDAIIAGQLYGWELTIGTWGSGDSAEHPTCLIYTDAITGNRQLRGYPSWNANDDPSVVDWVVYTWDGSAWQWTERIGYVNCDYDAVGNCVQTYWS